MSELTFREATWIGVFWGFGISAIVVFFWEFVLSPYLLLKKRIKEAREKTNRLK